MTVGQYLPLVSVVIGLLGVAALLVIVAAKVRRGQGSVRNVTLLAPHRGALIAMASGEDEDDKAKETLYAVSASTWVGLRPSVLAFLQKVRGWAADDLSDLLRFHGEIDRAKEMLTSRSAVRRAHAAYLLGLVRDPGNVDLLRALLADPDPDVRLVAARGLGMIGDASAAPDVLDAVGIHQGQVGLPAWVAAEALLDMGEGITPALKDGLISGDPLVRNVCVVVAGHGTFASVAPELRILLATDTADYVRTGATVALGLIGRADDVATLAWLTHASETTVLRRTAAAALGDLGRREGLDTLAGLLDDADRRLALLAAKSLVRIGSEGIARLRQAAGGQSPGARVAGAALELAGLRGQPDTVAVGA